MHVLGAKGSQAQALGHQHYIAAHSVVCVVRRPYLYCDIDLTPRHELQQNCLLYGCLYETHHFRYAAV